ncbi:hypothetical protein [Rhizobium redzepovicii]|uniref:hypothetical protein n=1 Tax=Rhizobium redzepovicii TaxID=2867518 RepID=UPI002871DB48|nr:hypothetical protein [Rhizobium redzepovicii]MDR9781027.1 hypothetical protein [Rhizobium redzepovicii]
MSGPVVVVLDGGAFDDLPVQKNFNLALVTIRTVLGERGSDQFADKAAKFRRMLAGFRPKVPLRNPRLR